MTEIQSFSGQEYADRDSAQYKRAVVLAEREDKAKGDA